MRPQRIDDPSVPLPLSRERERQSARTTEIMKGPQRREQRLDVADP